MARIQSSHHRRARGLAAAILVVSAVVLGLPAPTLVAQGETTFRPDPLTVTVGLGQVETVRIVIENVTDLYGAEIHLRFDPAVVEVVDADPAKDGIQMTAGPFPKPDFVVVNKADNISGTIEYALTQLNPTPPASGSGTLLTIQFRGKALGKTTQITAKGNILAVVTGPQKVTAAPYKWLDGAITVVEPKPPTPTPTSLATPTRPPAPTVTPAAAPTMAPTAAGPAPVPAPAGGISDQALLLIAIGGFAGALLILFLAWFLLLRSPPKPKRK